MYIFAVGLSNILDSELCGRHPAEGPHRGVVRAAVVDSELLCKVVQGIECVARIEAFLILAVAQLNHAKFGIPAAHVADELQLGLRVLAWMTVRSSEWQAREAALPFQRCFRPALVVLSASTAHAVFIGILHKELPISHVLCYTLAHEGYGLLPG